MRLLVLVVLVIVIVGIVLAIRWLVAQSRGRGSATDSALVILRERYARGEINRDEFEARRRDLEASPRTPPPQLRG